MVTNNPSFLCHNSLHLSRLWHCFGNYNHSVDRDTILQMIAVSGTNVLPINTHRLNKTTGRNALSIGFGPVRYDDVCDEPSVLAMTKMLNINHQTTAEAAIDRTRHAFSLLSEPVIKLEVLNEDLCTSNNCDLIKAVAKLRNALPELVVLPLLSCDPVAAKELVDLGCPVLRIMGSAIGSGGGIQNRDGFAEICALGIPVVLDGGIGSAAHLKEAIASGASGGLVNSVLFADDSGPVQILRNFMYDLGDTLLHCHAVQPAGMRQ
jgi:thiazole synthase